MVRVARSGGQDNAIRVAKILTGEIEEDMETESLHNNCV
jgi:hypothetical protein